MKISKGDPELHHEDIEWYLTQSAADLGIRSNFSALVASLEGLRGQPEPGSVMYRASQIELNTSSTAVARERRVRPLWARLLDLNRYHLAAYYTGRTSPHLERQLGRLATVALFISGDEAPELLDAAEIPDGKGSKQILERWRAQAEECVREAHRAYGRLEANQPRLVESTGLEGAYDEAMSEFGEPNLRRLGGVWRAR